jgi:DNA-binding LytR/AlgR family response regulator
MQFTHREWLGLGAAKPLLVAIPLGLLLGFLGPFGSNPAYPTATRYAFWLGLTLAGAAFSIAADALLARAAFPRPAVRIAAVAVLSALPMTFVVAWTMSLLQPGRLFGPLQLPALFAAVAAIQLLIVYATTMAKGATGSASELGARHPQAPVEGGAKTAAFPAAFLSRLPPHLGPNINALETEDHYLRVHAVGGSALILMRMADAVALLDPKLGVQVHRRWWVAEAAVVGLRTDGQKLSLELVDGSCVPVGRTFAASVRSRFAPSR